MLALGHGYGGTPTGIPPWVGYGIIMPLVIIFIVYINWLKRKK
jgi:hypothetical protein